ncbi:MAG TPA: Ig-like domain-containing protein, partial [Anaerolinea sp.]|nr:Ig-like domain-containing protein [Anaerolinea sp.]
DSNTFNLTVTVTAVNDPPVITAQAATLSTPEETALTIVLGDLTVTDPDSASFTLTVLDGTNYTHVGNTITPALNFTGDLSVPVKVNDGLADSNTFNLTVTVTPVNDPPVITEGTSVDVAMSVNGLPVAFNLTLHANDPDAGDTLTWSILTQATHGAAAASGTGASQAIAYTPDTNYAGTDSFVVQVSDGKGGTDSITVNVNIGVVTLVISGNTGLPGVTITYTGGSTITDSQGDYTFTVAYGWSGTITPSLAGYVFTPASTDLTNVTADQSGVNFTAKATNYPVFLPLIMLN